MFRKFAFLSSSSLFLLAACSGGFEKFAPPANSISGRGAKVNPRILSSTPSDGATVAQNPGSGGTQIKVVFDMTMRNDTSPVINTWVRDIGSNNDIIWYAVANSGATFTWSSTTYANDTVTIQLGWVRWPENNIIGFDFDNSTLLNLDDMPLLNENKISFTVGWNPGRYKVVQTGQEMCYSYRTTGADPNMWYPNDTCAVTVNDSPVGTQNFPAGQNGFIEPLNVGYGVTLYGASAGGATNGRRFSQVTNPMNMVGTYCNGLSSDSCFPYTIDSVTTLIWKTCTQGSYYTDDNVTGDKCTPASGSDFTWGQAVNACSVLNTANGGQGYGGRKDWRLPTIDELENLVDYGARSEEGEPEPSAAAPEVPAIDGQNKGAYPDWIGAFPNTPIKGFWTATGLSARLNGQTYYGETYVVEFKKGSMGAGGGSGSLLESKRGTSNRKKVRCVAGPSVEPGAQNLTAVTPFPGNGQALSTIGATFTGYDADVTFNVLSAKAGYDLMNSQHNIVLAFNKDVHTTSGGIPAHYHICAANAATDCGTANIATAVVSGKTVTLVTNTALGPNTPYRLFISSNVKDNATNLLSLTTDTILFSGAPTRSGPAAATVFNITNATTPDTSTVRVIFDRLPDAGTATNPGNYKLVSGNGVAVTWATAQLIGVSTVSLSGYTATLTTATAMSASIRYAVVTQGITFAGVQVVDDPVNKLRWQRCRKGTFDNVTCSDDGDATNDSALWNDALNYCDYLNQIRFDNNPDTSVSLRYAWRAPTINELKSIANRSLFGTVGVAIDTNIFPTPNVYAEDFASSTNFNLNGKFGYGSAPPFQFQNFNQAWGFNFIAGFPTIAQKDNSNLNATPGLKPPKKNIRCVRGLP